MKKSFLLGAVHVLCIVVGVYGAAHADIVATGTLNPSVPSWQFIETVNGVVDITNDPLRIGLPATHLSAVPVNTTIEDGSLTINSQPAPIHFITGQSTNSFFDSKIGQDGVGVVTLEGNGVTWTNHGTLYLGWRAVRLTDPEFYLVLEDSEGNGTVDVQGGATLVTEDVVLGRQIAFVDGGLTELRTEGTINVSSSSLWTNSGAISVGREGTGTVNIAGDVNTTNVHMGSFAGAIGTVNVSGGGTLTSGGCYVSHSGIGIMNVSDLGSSVSCTDLYVGIESDGIGTVNVSSGGNVSVTGSAGLGMASGSDGTLSITGGTVTTPILFIGDTAGSTGNVILNGSGASLATESIQVGLEGSGTLRILNGAQVLSDQNGSNFLLDQSRIPGSPLNNPTISGVVELAGTGSKWTIRQAESVDPFPVFHSLSIGEDGPGTLNVGAGTEVELVAVGAVQPGIWVFPTGTIKGNGTIKGDIVLIEGLLAPGASPGTLTVDGNLFMLGGTLEFEIAGLATGEFDVLDISGLADLQNGTIRFIFIDNFLPKTGDTISFLNTGQAINNTNVNFEFVGVDSSFEYSVTQGINLLTFTALNDAVPLQATDSDGDGIPDEQDNCINVPNINQRDTNGDGYGNRCDADFNGDLTVNLSDYSAFRSKFGTTDPDADFNGDGTVNLSDYSIFRAAFGKAPGPSCCAP